MLFVFPKVYPILDSSFIPLVGRAHYLRKVGSALSTAGLRLLEYRNKTGSDEEILADAAVLRDVLPVERTKLILDDRADLVLDAHFDGVHVDEGDLPVNEARWLLGQEKIIGTYGGGDDLLPGILKEPADYLAIGPVFPTKTKNTLKLSIKQEGVKRLRQQAGPSVVLSAVAGITLENAQSVLDAGASMVAVAAAIFGTEDPAAEFRKWTERLR